MTSFVSGERNRFLDGHVTVFSDAVSFRLVLAVGHAMISLVSSILGRISYSYVNRISEANNHIETYLVQGSPR